MISKFKYQLDLIKLAMLDKCIVMGDFNLEGMKEV